MNTDSPVYYLDILYILVYTGFSFDNSYQYASEYTRSSSHCVVSGDSLHIVFTVVYGWFRLNWSSHLKFSLRRNRRILVWRSAYRRLKRNMSGDLRFLRGNFNIESIVQRCRPSPSVRQVYYTAVSMFCHLVIKVSLDVGRAFGSAGGCCENTTEDHVVSRVVD